MNYFPICFICKKLVNEEDAIYLHKQIEELKVGEYYHYDCIKSQLEVHKEENKHE